MKKHERKECRDAILHCMAKRGGMISVRDLVEQMTGKKMTKAGENQYRKEGFDPDQEVNMTPKGHAAIGRAPN